ncbi:MAG: 6-phosphogluconate dehydrogenase [Candidatus Nomurabacteria bacterium GW2011_GWE1_32_28]|uniref:6-phosphogluconate dehydrogenase n=1 Tax=Candidatus Nomurabacteria bacterium GW2011_GWF1_31_48 TaxID=1618767 RepID=A0A0F9YU13_9BACT|nr:MAG: 6-phosphogluconate dehydrogenase [Candidatus Nomurabacteria bacterium GW2011_GWF2_30_133]KKP28371.1 MAG: 6-phosphogluconate dehydrogenase [Candidatus Nomurabacteria bacterium GW2011_GWE2_31_40]KKP29956.1 MAG: 6-phosphogluconate dehydrogenase [Candidatus Nomurabacteria bacterium GW2011_GWF1_31_48]KKP35117.1 MAG: 6-phosphogluconate dehydrogenase [Candidatus Nomurabacteria bacterium GW2011_GWE1_32_28]HAS80929.1 6-phosphogluconate dehydrogenase [Candidatus Nomurabacteria bacterium]
MKIAISGLGKMGAQIAKKLYESSVDVIAHNRSKEKVDEMVALGMKGAYSKNEVIDSFNGDRVMIWMMVPADVVDSEIEEWIKIIPKNSILIDGGNSDYRLTKKRAILVSENGSVLMDVGTSGGIWGYENGFSMMTGGDSSIFEIIKPILQILEKPNGAHEYFGEAGSGHYVKMTHNAIEYGMMESIAEGYRLLKEGPYKNIDLIKAGEVWQHRSVITSWLNELTLNALKENVKAEGVDGVVVESGETRFALETAKEFNIETPSIQASFDVRLASQKGNVNFTTKLLCLMRNAFGGHKINGK